MKIYVEDGTGFQALVSGVFKATYNDFQVIAAWGKSGDGGNDGYIPAEGRYLQVYGPKARSNWEPVAASKKAEKDFVKLREKWYNLRHYSFVLNDRFCGMPAPVEHALQRIGKEHRIKTDGVTSATLTNMFCELSDGVKEEIVGGIPDSRLDCIDPRAVGELLSYLANQAPSIQTKSKGFAPDFEEKLKFNRLSDAVASRLRANSYQNTEVTVFFNTRDQWIAQSIADELRKFYADSKDEIPDVEDAADLRYVRMIEKIVPHEVKGDIYKYKAFQYAAEAILAHFFEACDVYEKPTISGRTT